MILLATGETKNLHPLSATVPSSMIPLLNQPVMAYGVELLARQGVKQVWISLFHLASQIETYFCSGIRWGVNFHYLIQPKPWGTAGSLWWARKHLQETFLVAPADTLLDVDINDIIEYHTTQKHLATVVVHQSKRDHRLAIGPGGIVHGLAPSRSQEHPWCDTGFYLFEPEVIALVPPRTPFDIHSQLIPRLLACGYPVSTFKCSGYWNPLDTFQSYQEAQRVLLHAAWPHGQDASLHHLSASLPNWKQSEISDGIWVGKNNRIHPSVHLTPPVHMGENCLVGKNVQLGPDAVIGRNTVIDNDASVYRSTILEHTYVGKNVRIQDRFINRKTLIDFHTNKNTIVHDPLVLGTIHPDGLRHTGFRIANIILAFLLLVIASPLIIVIAAWLKLVTGRCFATLPILTSDAKDWDGIAPGSLRIFALHQFRTLDPDGQWYPLAKWIKSLEWHRIPELWNVIQGDMDLVGVSLLQPSQAFEIQEEWQKTRWRRRPGFTGFWYVYGDQITDFEDLLLADAYYAASRSSSQDLVLLLKTPAVWWRKVRKEIRSLISAGEKHAGYGNAD